MRPSSSVAALRLLVAASPLLAVGCFGKILPPEEEALTVRSGKLPDAGPAPKSGACAAAMARVAFGFDDADEGWTHGQVSAFSSQDGEGNGVDPWVRGAARVGTPCHGGACFGTELVANYRECQAAHLVSPPIDLADCAGESVALVFEHAFSFARGGTAGADWYDGGYVEASADGEDWIPVTPTSGYPGTLAPRENEGVTTCDLPTWLAGTPSFVGDQEATSSTRITLPPEVIGSATRLRFTMASGRARVETGQWDETRYLRTAYWGWRIDDVRFEPP